MSLRLTGLILIGCLPLATSAAPAADVAGLSLEDLLDTPISSPSKRPQRPAEAPSMVSVIGREEIRRFGWRSLAEALNSLPGVHVSYDRNTTYLGLRGFGRPGDYNNRVLMLVDGVAINDGIYDQAPVGSDFPLDMALVERIEYVPGAGSVMYGGNALFGVINVITTSGARLGGELEAGAGSGRGFDLRASRGERSETGSDWLLSASRTRRRGADLYFESYDQPGPEPWSRGVDYEAVDRFFGRYSRGGLDVSLIASDRNKGVPGGPWAIDLSDPGNREREQRLLASVRYEARLDADTALYLQGNAERYYYAGYWVTGGVAEPVDKAENSSVGGEVRVVSTVFPAQTLVAGVAWREDGRRHQFNASLDVDTPRRNLGVFIQNDWAIDPRLMLSLGLRHDTIRANSRETHTSPRLALIARPLPTTTLKLIAGAAFRPPNGFETDYVYAGTNVANPALRAESIHSTELGVEHAVNGAAQLAASVYRNRIRDLVVMETDVASGLQQHHNVGGAVARGLEVAARGAFDTRWGGGSLRGSLAWQQLRHDNGVAVANAPTRLAKLLVSLPLPGSLRLTWETHYLGPRTTDSGLVDVAGDAVGGHALSHLGVQGEIGRGLSWQLRVANLFDRRHGAVVGTEFSANFPGAQVAPMPLMPQDGRSLHGSVLWRF